MYNLKDIKDVHFEITSKCQAKCPMCPRRIAGGPLNPFIKLDEVSLETFKKWFPESFIKQLNSMFMCGNLGDPIISKDTLENVKDIVLIRLFISHRLNNDQLTQRIKLFKILDKI